MTALLEDYALIGDRRTAALVCRNGAIDWLCWPRFDSDACFAALLGNETNGRWLIAPEQPGRVSRRYQTDTLVLETDFATAASAVRVIDFMPPPHTGPSAVVRLVVGLQTLDGSLLLMPLVGFLPADDPRMAGTIAAIERELMHDGLVWRKSAAGGAPEGAFLACSCWLADCRSLQGRDAAARAAFERLLAVRNDVGLLSEEYNLRGRHLAGNFPQALSHLALVTTALGLSGPVLQRGGG